MEFTFILQNSITGTVTEEINEPMMKYIKEHLQLVRQLDSSDFMPDMDTMFAYVNNLVKEFMNANRLYTKPASFHITYSKPSCCAPEIIIECMSSKIMIHPERKSANVPKVSGVLAIIALFLAMTVMTSCQMERKMTGKQYVAKQQKEMMWKGYKKMKK